ncbi:MAG: HIT family protein [Microthrixaceae bacterium]
MARGGGGGGDGPGGECVFCGIVAGEMPAHEVWRDDDVVAFLDRSPLFVGHTLVVPVEHHETVTDLPAAQVEPFFAQVRRLTAAVRAGTGSAGAFVAMNNVVSQSVPHLHAHVVPRNRGDGLKGFFWPRTRYHDDAHMADTAATLRRALDTLPPLP